MEEIDEFLTFIMENNEDDRISIHKSMKYGHQFFTVVFKIDKEAEQEEDVNSINAAIILTSKTPREYVASAEIYIDNRNNCIAFTYQNNQIIYENKQLVEKWSLILDDYLNDRISSNTRTMVDKILSRCANKNLHRDFKFKKIFKDDEHV